MRYCLLFIIILPIACSKPHHKSIKRRLIKSKIVKEDNNQKLYKPSNIKKSKPKKMADLAMYKKIDLDIEKLENNYKLIKKKQDEEKIKAGYKYCEVLYIWGEGSKKMWVPPQPEGTDVFIPNNINGEIKGWVTHDEYMRLKVMQQIRRGYSHFITGKFSLCNTK